MDLRGEVWFYLSGASELQRRSASSFQQFLESQRDPAVIQLIQFMHENNIYAEINTERYKGIVGQQSIASLLDTVCISMGKNHLHYYQYSTS